MTTTPFQHKLRAYSIVETEKKTPEGVTFRHIEVIDRSAGETVVEFAALASMDIDEIKSAAGGLIDAARGEVSVDLAKPDPEES